jgi:hypothetical protein
MGGEEEGGGVGGERGEMTQTLYAHMNKRKKIANLPRGYIVALTSIESSFSR